MQDNDAQKVHGGDERNLVVLTVLAVVGSGKTICIRL